MDVEEKVPILTAFYSKPCHMNALFSEERRILATMHLLPQRNLVWGGQVICKVTGPFEGFYKILIIWISAENVMTAWHSEFYGVKLCLLSNRSMLCKLQFHYCLRAVSMLWAASVVLAWVPSTSLGTTNVPPGSVTVGCLVLVCSQ